MGLWFLKDSSGNEIDEKAGVHEVLQGCSSPDDVAWHLPLTSYWRF